jgi:hypothetical protein
MIKKPWYKSRTIWLAIFGTAALVTQAAVGEQLIPLEYQASALLIAQFILRFVTSESVTLPAASDVTTGFSTLLTLLRVRK